MNYAELANPGVMEQPVYEAGKPIEYVAREYGLDPSKIAKLASNENPFGPSPKATVAGQKSLEQAHLYPDGGGYELRRAIAQIRGIHQDQIILGNGSNEIIELLGHAFLRPGLEVVMGSQAFIVYKLVTKLFGAIPVEVPMANYAHDLNAMLEAVNARTRIVFVASPNNPTGAINSESDLIEFAKALPEHVIFCLDEAYAEYLDKAPDLRALIAAGRKIICLRTFSKIYGLGGLRIGYGYADAGLIELLHRVRQPFNVNAVAQASALGALEDEDFVNMCRSENERGREFLLRELSAMGYDVFGGHANFILCRVEDGARVFQALQAQGVIVRPLAPYGMPEFVRITIGRPEENAFLLEALSQLLSIK